MRVWLISWVGLVGMGVLLCLGTNATAAETPNPTPHLQLTGLTDPALIRNVGLSVPPIRFDCAAPEVMIQRYLASARTAAEQALQALGHFNARIETSMTDIGGCREPALSITPGPVVRIAAVQLKIRNAAGDDLSQAAFLRDFLRTAVPTVGAPLNQGVYTTLREGIWARVRGQGYLDARWRTHELIVDPKTNTARFDLDMAAGKPYRIGTITVEQSILKPALAERLTGSRPGDPYSTRTLVAMNQNLLGSDYFSDVRVRPQTDARVDDTIPIVIKTTASHPSSYEARIGYGTDTGARLGAKMQRRYINSSGHHWKADFSLAQRQQTLNATYTIPRLSDPLKQHYDIYATIDRERNLGITTLSSTTGAQWVRNFNRWTSSLFSEYLLERSQFGSTPAKTSHFWLMGARLGWQNLNDLLFPTRGLVFNATLSTAARPLLSSASLIRGDVMLGGLYPIGDWIFKGRVELGGISTSDFSQMPKSLRFFAGGDQSVRGYAYQSLGPKDATGQVIGGQYLITSSAEAMYPVYGRNWYAAAFVDSGNAFDTLQGMHLNTGAGVGVRWRSPVGQVRVDVAYPFDGTSHTPRLSLGIGAAF
ncbi:MAG TPA: autotransporter assembly complex family protein [Halothiobacillus sp.]|nr:autotransporter assembly complex family protein [Halothiobacillus sp.]